MGHEAIGRYKCQTDFVEDGFLTKLAVSATTNGSHKGRIVLTVEKQSFRPEDLGVRCMAE